MITEEHHQQLDKIISVATEHESLLTDWERGFISEWADSLTTHGTRVRVSDKQQQTFERIETKLRKNEVL